MTQAQEQMLSILDSALHNRPGSPVTDWPEILRNLELHTVSALVSPIVADCGLSESDLRDYSLATLQEVQSFHSMLRQQEELQTLLEKENISYCVLKGLSVARFYPNPELRKVGDLDVLIAPQDYERAEKIFLSSHFRFAEDSANNPRHFAVIGKENVRIEVHRYYSVDPSVETNRLLDEAIFEGLKEASFASVESSCVKSLPVLETGLVLLDHINHHISSGIGLRHIIDWQMFVENCLDDDFWSSRFCAAADRIGLKKLAVTVTDLCAKYLGLSTRITWYRSSDENLADDLLEYVLVKGNFGRGQEKSQRDLLSVLHKFRNPLSAFRYLTDGGLAHWKFAREHVWMKPFAWIYQIFHLLSVSRKRKISLGDAVNGVSLSGREVDLLRRLEVTRI